MIKNIVFDFGGVLVDWNPHYLFDSFLGSRDKADWFLSNICTHTWIRQMDAGKTFDQGVAELAAQHPDWADAIYTYRSRWREMISGLMPGMEDYVKELKREGYHVYGLSNWVKETFDIVEQEFSVFQELEGMVISGREGVIKPFPEIYRLLLTRYNLQADECVFVDDVAENVEGARAVGMQGILFRGLDNLRNEINQL
uniref:HAD-IA family hydrolase n=1 Tax=Prevotella sp. GTC17259 TaxID=3236795 RepID=A0AB33J356_9BACT